MTRRRLRRFLKGPVFRAFCFGGSRELATRAARRTGPRALSDFFNEGGGVAVVRVADSATVATVMANIVGSATTNTGAYALLRPAPRCAA
jgi:acyl-CoA reductase-like NAD-dependent aldehyde dehydrogenase